MSDTKMSECCTCGTKWQTGQDGRHSCSRKLKTHNDTLVAQNLALKAALVEILDKAGNMTEYLDEDDCNIENEIMEIASELLGGMSDE